MIQCENQICLDYKMNCSNIYLPLIRRGLVITQPLIREIFHECEESVCHANCADILSVLLIEIIEYLIFSSNVLSL